MIELKELKDCWEVKMAFFINQSGNKITPLKKDENNKLLAWIEEDLTYIIHYVAGESYPRIIDSWNKNYNLFTIDEIYKEIIKGIK